jgi:anti-sigma B factor antagonist
MEWNTCDTDAEGFTRIRLRGDCDLYAAPAFAREMLGRIAAGEGPLLFDLSGVAYLDSSGVGAIVKIVQAARKIGSKVLFSGISGTPRRVLDLANILPLLVETDACGAAK